MDERERAVSGRRVGDRIILGGVIVGGASVIVRLSALIYRWVLQWAYVDPAFREAHFFAFGIVIMVFVIVQQAVAPAFLPVFMGELGRGDRRSAWRFASTVFVSVVAITAAAAGLCTVFPDVWSSLSELLTGREPPGDASELLSAQVPLMVPAFVGISSSVVTYMVLNGFKRFFWAQAAEGVMRLAMIVAIFVALGSALSGSAAAKALAVGATIGCFARLATHLVAMGREAFSFRAPDFTSEAHRRYLWLIAPLIIGIVFAQVRDFVNNYAVLFPLELVTPNGNGRTLYTAMANLVPWALGVAMFPYFCELVDRNDLRELGKILTRSGRVLALAFFAFAGAVAVMSKPFIYAIYGSTGTISAGDLRLAAVANTCYILVLPAYAVEQLVMQGFFSNRKMIAPTVLGVIFSFLSVGISIVGIRSFRLTGASALATVALGFTFARYLKTVALVAALKRHIPMFPARASGVFFAKAAAVAGVCAGSAWLVRALYEARWPLEATLAKGRAAMLLRIGPEIAIAGAVSIAAGIVSIRLLGMEELAWVVDWVRRKRSGGSRPGSGPEVVA